MPPPEQSHVIIYAVPKGRIIIEAKVDRYVIEHPTYIELYVLHTLLHLVEMDLLNNLYTTRPK